MAQPLTAVEYLAAPSQYAPAAVCALYGNEPFLRRQALLRLRAAVLSGDEGEFSYSSFDGESAEWRDVFEELATVAMFGGGRLVAVEGADDFVSRYRTQLEDYVAKPRGTGVLVLELKSFPSNTKLYKAVAAAGLAIDCAAPAGALLPKWLGRWAKQAHGVELPLAAAEELVDLIGPELGLIDQELAKLAVSAEAGQKITPELIGRVVGGWRARTAWDMLDAALEGDVGAAMTQLDRLLASGEQPVGVLGQISASLRRFAAATRVIVAAETAGQRVSLPQALKEAGMKFYLDKAEKQLRRLTRRRGAQLYQWLLEADLDLKGASPLPPRLILERLILRLAVPAAAAER